VSGETARPPLVRLWPPLLAFIGKAVATLAFVGANLRQLSVIAFCALRLLRLQLLPFL